MKYVWTAEKAKNLWTEASAMAYIAKEAKGLKRCSAADYLRIHHNIDVFEKAKETSKNAG